MTNQEILTKVIQKAVDNGFPILSEKWHVTDTGLIVYEDLKMPVYNEPYTIIFSIPFAIAFWGKDFLYLVDSSPDWSHDLGDKEVSWVNEKQLEKMAKHWNESMKQNIKDEESVKILHRTGLDFAIVDEFSYLVHLGGMAKTGNPFKYLEKFL